MKLQDEYEVFLLVADYHALTRTVDKEHVTATVGNTRQLVLDYLSVGIDPDKTTIYVQSDVPSVCELHLLFSMLTTVPRLERVPTLKEVMDAEHIEQPSYGLLGYPVLQAADILHVRANLVPVGKDQASHVEVTREIARRFNFLYDGEVFPEPEALDRRCADAGGHGQQGQDVQVAGQCHPAVGRRGNGAAEGDEHVHRSHAHPRRHSRQSRRQPGLSVSRCVQSEHRKKWKI